MFRERWPFGRSKEAEDFKVEEQESPEKWKGGEERWHSIDGVKDYLKERIDYFNQSGYEENIAKAKELSELSKQLNKGYFEGTLREIEKIMGSRLTSIEEGDKIRGYNHFLGEYADQSLPEQERFRAMADILTEKGYETRGRKLKPATYEETANYLEKDIKSWGLDEEDSSVTFLREAIKSRDYPALANQIDVNISETVSGIERLREGDIEFKRFMEDKYSGLTSPSPMAGLLIELENLRRYRKFLYEQMRSQEGE